MKRILIIILLISSVTVFSQEIIIEDIEAETVKTEKYGSKNSNSDSILPKLEDNDVDWENLEPWENVEKYAASYHSYRCQVPEKGNINRSLLDKLECPHFTISGDGTSIYYQYYGLLEKYELAYYYYPVIKDDKIILRGRTKDNTKWNKKNKYINIKTGKHYFKSREVHDLIEIDKDGNVTPIYEEWTGSFFEGNLPTPWLLVKPFFREHIKFKD
ncbi:hypothetical protein [Zobellia laminariae]|uniref:hypothetical protein n=1 Tax=Zobellia laminariae TaxID=248906 RepID=UPI0026F436B7|nr:hypothetical protein [Zobellia laminariae]WKX76272.1 hypothetical protein Q5W13_22405 [Zobellia laminariae]